MRHYAKPSSIGANLGYPPDGKRFGRALVEVGLRDSRGRPTADALARGIAKQGTFRGRWEYDVDTAISSFGLAINRRYHQGDEQHEETMFIDVTCFGRNAKRQPNFSAGAG